jgi:hypothetical protein
MLPLGRIEMFDRIAQRRTGHGCCVLIKKASQLIGVDLLSRFSERPAHGLVDQVMTVGQQDHGQAVEIGCFTAA